MSNDVEAQLLAEFCGALEAETGLQADLARPFAAALLRYLQREHGGTSIYIPLRKRRHDRALLESALRDGVSSRDVAKQHGITRRGLYRLFPGGLPKPTLVGARNHG